MINILYYHKIYIMSNMGIKQPLHDRIYRLKQLERVLEFLWAVGAAPLQV